MERKKKQIGGVAITRKTPLIYAICGVNILSIVIVVTKNEQTRFL